MRRKRLKHCSFILCHMFCGWRLYSDWDALAGYGPGAIEINVLAETCWHNGKPIPVLTIAKELRSWLLGDLEAHHIPFDALKEARLSMEGEK